MQVNIKGGKKTVKATQAEIKALKRATAVASDAKAAGLPDCDEVINSIADLLFQIEDTECGAEDKR